MRAANDRRKAELAKIHIAKAQLGLDEETYRAMLWTQGCVHSSADLDAYGRQRVLDHLRSRGFDGKRKSKTFPDRPHNVERSPQLRKIEALLADARRPWSYADSMCQRMFHIDRVTFANPEQLQKLISALAIDQKRRARQAAQGEAQC